MYFLLIYLYHFQNEKISIISKKYKIYKTLEISEIEYFNIYDLIIRMDFNIFLIDSFPNEILDS